ncbi:hypothetical protein [Methyloceanibacter methanicus]|uniref:hypothetical protein n=1 Tax=Methyloceanibacter methanicus TaxID=1774968 RepID=UPI00114CB462|nr:hypothetical protein [Methyloceanibacter methanicus]
MARGRCTFRQQDVTRALRATVAAGIDVQRIEIDKDGKIVVVTGRPREEAEESGENEWDRL